MMIEPLIKYGMQSLVIGCEDEDFDWFGPMLSFKPRQLFGLDKV